MNSLKKGIILIGVGLGLPTVLADQGVRSAETGGILAYESPLPRQEIPRRYLDSRQAPPRTRTRPTKPAKEDPSLVRERCRKAIGDGDFDLAESLLRAGLANRKKTEKEAWQIISAELDVARKRFAEAGLTAMRIVILSPRSPERSAALYWAGRAYEGIERPEKAADLYRECLEQAAVPASIGKAARARIGAIEKTERPGA